jgi:polygalacturonase
MHRPWILFLLLCATLNAAEPAPCYNVRTYGATGDGKTLDSDAINKAIDAAADAGGGTVIVPAGTYLSGSIHLKSNINLLIDAGATILGAPQSMKAYDPAEPFPGQAYQDGGHTHFHNSLIWGENLTNVTIGGRGTINGGGLVSNAGLLDHLNGYASPAPQTPSTDDLRIGNKAVCLKLCRNVLIHDVTIAHGGHFAILVTGCDNLAIDHVTIDTNRDGMDIDCCRNTTVSNCLVNSPNDDGICPKSTFALGEIRLTETLTITNCQVSGFEEGTLLDGTMKPGKRHNGRIKFGTESSGGFRNCTVSNCTFRHCLGLALEEVDGGIMEDIAISNITMVDVPGYAIYITTGKRNRTPNLTTNSRAGNISIANVVADGVGKMSGIQIMGLPEQPIEGVRLDNIRLISDGGGTSRDAAIVPKELGTDYPEPSGIGTLPAYGIFARHVRDLDLSNIRLGQSAPDFRPAASFTDVQGLEIDNLKPQLAPGVHAAVFAPDVSGVVIRDSPGIEQ